MGRKAIRGVIGGIICAMLEACALMLVAVIAPEQAYAEGSRQASIAVGQSYQTDSTGARKTFTYVLEAQTAGAPMPEGASGSTFTWSMTGDDSVTITIPFETLPIDGYTYTAYQNEPPTSGYTFDSTVYTLKLLPAGEEVEGGAVIIAYDAAGAKPSEVCWSVGYEKPAEPPVPDHGPDTGDRGISPLMDILIVGGCTLIILAVAFMPRRKGGSHA